jgi:hypothetical protein
MIDEATHLDSLQRELEHPTNGYVGVADCLLKLGKEHDLSLEWREGKCRVTRLHDGEKPIEVPLSKGKIRDVLARVALCSGISPYGGERLVRVEDHPDLAFWVELANTTAKQHVTIKRTKVTFATRNRENLKAWSSKIIWAARRDRWKTATYLLLVACFILTVAIMSK